MGRWQVVVEYDDEIIKEKTRKSWGHHYDEAGCNLYSLHCGSSRSFPNQINYAHHVDARDPSLKAVVITKHLHGDREVQEEGRVWDTWFIVLRCIFRCIYLNLFRVSCRPILQLYTAKKIWTSWTHQAKGSQNECIGPMRLTIPRYRANITMLALLLRCTSEKTITVQVHTDDAAGALAW